MRSVLMTALLAVGCDRRPPPPPQHTVMVCDRSSSADCSEEVVALAGASFLDRNPPGASRFEVRSLGASLHDVRALIEIVLPDQWGAGMREKRRRFNHAQLDRFMALKLPPVVEQSAVAAAVWKAGRVLQERRALHQELVIVSDMREVSAVANFERSVPGPDQWVKILRKTGLLGDLSGVVVTVCGVHDRTVAGMQPWTPDKSEALRAAWAKAFAAMGAPGVALTEACDFHPRSIRPGDLTVAGATP